MGSQIEVDDRNSEALTHDILPSQGSYRGPHICKHCKYLSHQRVEHLEQHIFAVHDEIRMFKCFECYKQLTNKYHLKRHTQLVHEKKMDQQCDQCTYTTSNKDNLMLHINHYHKQLRAIKCCHCKYA